MFWLNARNRRTGRQVLVQGGNHAPTIQLIRNTMLYVYYCYNILFNELSSQHPTIEQTTAVSFCVAIETIQFQRTIEV